ncbi:MAG: hypothetical protein GXY59_03165 [Bacteroidales bacterium]|nr:hypothetical protein [Bacteroidales bacterium]
MIDKRGFFEVFAETLNEARESGSPITHRDCYENLEGEYFEAFGRRRYRNFESFRRGWETSLQHGTN